MGCLKAYENNLSIGCERAAKLEDPHGAVNRYYFPPVYDYFN